MSILYTCCKYIFPFNYIFKQYEKTNNDEMISIDKEWLEMSDTDSDEDISMDV